MSTPRILVAGIGNIFLGDDAFGSEAVRQLEQETMPDQVHVQDFGIRSYDLAYALADGYDAVVLVDATPRGEAPGTVYLIELDPAAAGAPEMAVNGHSLNPAIVLQMAAAMAAPPAKLYLVGCEPEKLDCDDGNLGLSPSVQAAIPPALDTIRSLVGELLQEPKGVEP